MRTQLNSYLLFCDYCAFEPFPVSKQAFLAYLAFLSKSLSCYRSLVNYVNILKHIKKSLGADFFFMHNYDAFLTQRALRRIMGDSVRVTHPVTIGVRAGGAAAPPVSKIFGQNAKNSGNKETINDGIEK